MAGMEIVLGAVSGAFEIVKAVHSIAGKLSIFKHDAQESKELVHVMKCVEVVSQGEVKDEIRWWLMDAINDALEVKPSGSEQQRLLELEKKWQLVPQQIPPVPINQGEYHNLHGHLKRCLGFCSIFPNGWMFEREKLCRMWIAHGFIIIKGSLGSGSRRIREEDVAERHFDDLVQHRLFKKIVHQGIDRYEIPQEMHSMLRQEVAPNYCLSIDDSPRNENEIPPTVRHLSVKTDYVHQLQTYPPAWLRKLRTLLVFNEVNNGGGGAGAASSSTSRASTGPIDEKVPKIVLKAVRVLNLSNTCITELAETTAAELTNVRYIALPKTIKDLPGMEGMEKLEWADIAVEGRRMNKLEKLNSLRGTLSIKDLETVDRTKAKKARLSNKEHVEVLKLEWGHQSVKETEKSAGQYLKKNVLDDLQPHPNLQKLYVTFYAGTASPNWLQNPEALGNLTSLYLKDCRQLLALPPVGELPLLKILSFDGLHTVKNIDSTFCRAGGLFTNLDTMVLHHMRSLETWDTNTAAGAGDDDRRIAILFPKLKMLKITHCPKLTSLRGLLHCRDSLESLTVKDCKIVAGTFSTSMFPKLTQKDYCPGLFKEC